MYDEGFRPLFVSLNQAGSQLQHAIRASRFFEFFPTIIHLGKVKRDTPESPKDLAKVFDNVASLLSKLLVVL